MLVTFRDEIQWGVKTINIKTEQRVIMEIFKRYDPLPASYRREKLILTAILLRFHVVFQMFANVKFK